MSNARRSFDRAASDERRIDQQRQQARQPVRTQAREDYRQGADSRKTTPFVEGVRMIGRIKSIVRLKGFGFIGVGEPNKPGYQEFFFHKSQAGDFDIFDEGEMVSFQPTNTPKGPRATDVNFHNEV